ncbi:family 2 encapsulin nanocompartment cargo protein terpene cyclase [Nocardia sp. IBHARD005]|uniref:family 2 encapsulin nanocompartment cargo protein terpene cyclase n=1 Tax=Nocardia sp. IBHARD005 TaxID=3457765 RepID=UPI004059C15F
MSILTRAGAPIAAGDLAVAVAALLHGAAAPADLFAGATPPPRRASSLLSIPRPSVPKSPLTQRASLSPPEEATHTPHRVGTVTPRRLLGPTGLGTSGLRLFPTQHSPAGSSNSIGQQAIPALYCPPPERDDPALAEAVNAGLLAWAAEIGLYEGRLDELGKADFGRLIMLAHPDCDDPHLLLGAARCAVAEWSVDDYYCEEDAPGDTAPDGTPSSAAAELGPRLELAAAAMDPAHLPARYAPRLEQAMQADPILRAFRTSFAHLAGFASPAQLARLRTEIAGWFIALGAEAGWRAAHRMPPVWEYLTNRQPHSFLPCMAPIDAVGGYELSAADYADPAVRRVVTTAALAAQMVNDLYSMAREDLSGGREFNLPTVLAAEEGCSRAEAVQRTAQIHDELMHRFEREAAPLAASGSPQLRRFLAGLWAWMGGNRAWHAGSRRYHDTTPGEDDR